LNLLACSDAATSELESRLFSELSTAEALLRGLPDLAQPAARLSIDLVRGIIGVYQRHDFHEEQRPSMAVG
jgi:hypothetical protein